MNKKNILLTCFGSNIFYEVFLDFQKRADMNLFVSDINPQSKAKFLTDNFIPVLKAEDQKFCSDLLEKCKAQRIAMIIPGGDEEAFALMKGRSMFRDAGIEVAVQDENLFSVFQSKTNMYDHLKTKGFPVPWYRKFRTQEEFSVILSEEKYPARPFLIKPNSARGGRGITILSEKVIANRDNLALMDKQLFNSMIDGREEYLVMEYIEGTVYDIDVLRYKDGRLYFGVRKRFNNVTKLFSGNIFENKNQAVLRFARQLYEAFPTKYLIDYDFMVTQDGRIELLEVNPRPSGSTISYLPFDINLYYVLAQSYLEGKHIAVDKDLDGNHAVTFYKMVEGKI